MEQICSNLAMLSMIILTARQAQIPPEMVLAIIEAESGGQVYAVRVNPGYPYLIPQAKRPDGCNPKTEHAMQCTAWGLMQVMGATARGMGFEGWLSELTDPEINIAVGAAYLARLTERYGVRYGSDGVIAAYNAGAPRRGADGKFLNQAYVDSVRRGMKKYAHFLREKEREAMLFYLSDF